MLMHVANMGVVGGGGGWEGDQIKMPYYTFQMREAFVIS